MAEVDAASDTVVIVIDLQTAMFEPTPVFDANALAGRVRGVIGWAREHHHRLCFIRHDSNEDGDPLQPGGPGWQVWEGLGQLPDEPTFSKSVGDAFSQPRLVEWLQPARNVILLGAQSEYCVAATTAGAIDRGLTVTVVGDAHSTWSSTESLAAQIIAGQNLSFEKQGAKVVTTQTLLASTPSSAR